MKANTTLTIVTLCVICAAIMTGCIGSSDEKNIENTVLDKVDNVDDPALDEVVEVDEVDDADSASDSFTGTIKATFFEVDFPEYKIEVTMREDGTMELMMDALSEPLSGTWIESGMDGEYMVYVCTLSEGTIMTMFISDTGEAMLESTSSGGPSSEKMHGTWVTI